MKAWELEQKKNPAKDGGDDTDPDLTRSSLFDPESDALLKVMGCRKVTNVT